MNFIIDNTMPNNIVKTLSQYGNIYISKKINTEDDAISSHPDLQIHFVSDNIAFTPKSTYEYYRKILPKSVRLFEGNSDIGFTYPKICAYNIARVGKFIICNTKYADKNILDYYSKNLYNIIHVNQGYAKCNICPITEDVLITEDAGIYETLRHIPRITAYIIEKGDVSLNGYEYGFIGGATGLIPDNLILCSGRLIKNNYTIKKILKNYNVNMIELSNFKAYDYGSILSFE